MKLHFTLTLNFYLIAILIGKYYFTKRVSVWGGEMENITHITYILGEKYLKNTALEGKK